MEGQQHLPGVAAAFLHDLNASLRRDAWVVAASEWAEVGIHFAKQTTLQHTRQSTARISQPISD
jgi:hypothetical protein